jgi:hypothetical protein
MLAGTAGMKSDRILTAIKTRNGIMDKFFIQLKVKSSIFLYFWVKNNPIHHKF